MIFPVRPGPRGVARLPCSGLHFCCPELRYPGCRCSLPAGGPPRPWLYPLFRLAKTLPILIRVSATTPSPTHRSMPSSPRYRLRLSPCRRLSTLIRPSQPVLHFCPLRNQRFFWCCRRDALRVERFGIETRFTPSAWASRSFSAESNLCLITHIY